MNKFVKQRSPRAKKIILVEHKEKVKPKTDTNIIKKGKQEFVICPKCGWKHKAEEKRCRFCGTKL